LDVGQLKYKNKKSKGCEGLEYSQFFLLGSIQKYIPIEIKFVCTIEEHHDRTRKQVFSKP